MSHPQLLALKAEPGAETGKSVGGVFMELSNV